LYFLETDFREWIFIEYIFFFSIFPIILFFSFS
jgi:hypothetical protein